MEELDQFPHYYAPSPEAWREWLKENHEKTERIWLLYYKKGGSMTSLSWSEAVDEALCFGWVDSTKKTIDAERYIQLFSKRKKTSTWSATNKKKIKELSRLKKMYPAGLKCIEIAKLNGMWTFLDDVENLVLPEDFKVALEVDSSWIAFYEQMSPSNKKGCLHFLKMAKRQETRDKRIARLLKDIKNGTIPRPYL